MRHSLIYIYHWFYGNFPDPIPTVPYKERQWVEKLLREAEVSIHNWDVNDKDPTKVVSPLYLKFREAIGKPMEHE